MKLIIGLGNPGSQYEATRHNAGFIAIDEFARKNDIEFRLEPKLKGAIGVKVFNGEKVMLLKPMTYMNLSGESVIAVMNYYKIEVDDIIVISDDLDSPLGRIRLRDHGSSGGHNGHKSIVNHIHTESYKRIKIGIGRDNNIPVVDWVLKKLNEEELAIINQAAIKCSEALMDFVNGIDFMRISSKYSTKA
ncbi:MAG: aminoacyl-tRNA hydrolase [Acholeplasmatales bacterium]|nr:aminoacyl-tRNA hydrolase [Acholeplasmatales bacterium]